MPPEKLSPDFMPGSSTRTCRRDLLNHADGKSTDLPGGQFVDLPVQPRLQKFGFAKPTGRANARPMTGSATKQSTLAFLVSYGLLRSQ
jgi:hypothetical protein